MTTTNDLIFVTGGTGFLARHTILRLLAKNYRVRTSLRSPARNAQLRSVLAAAGANVGNLETIQADLMDAACWPDALAGVSHVLHMASPMQGSDVLAAALDGTRHVLRASAKAGARRVVLTSSGLAALHPARKVDAGGRVDEADWTDTDRARLDDYARAKTLAEQEAWCLANDYNLRLTSLLPGAIVGPALGPERGGWLDLVADMLAGKMRTLPPIKLQMVDVRDLAELHVKALFASEAAGQRYLVASGSLSFREVAEILRQDMGEAAFKVSTKEMPAWSLRLAALVSPQARRVLPLLGPLSLLGTAKVERELGWAPRTMRESIVDMARSLLGQTMSSTG